MKTRYCFVNQMCAPLAHVYFCIYDYISINIELFFSEIYRAFGSLLMSPTLRIEKIRLEDSELVIG